MILLWGLLWGIGISEVAWAADLKAPVEVESAQVLPAGVRNPRYRNLFMSIDTRFNGQGGAEPLGQKLNREITWGNLLSQQESEDDRTKLKGLLKSTGINYFTGGPGATTGQVNSFVNVKIPVLAMGVTDWLTLAVAVPVLSIDLSADSGFIGNAEGQKFLDTLCASDVVKCNEVKARLADATNQKLTALGYEPIRSQSVQSVGDVKIVTKVLAYSSEWDALSVKGEWTLPTGREPNPDKVLDTPTGDGQPDLGATLIWDRDFSEELRFNLYGGYTVQLADRIEKRIPTSELESLSADKEVLRRDLGDVVSWGSAISYQFASVGLTVGGGYNFQYLKPTTYQNGALEAFRYRLLEKESPEQLAHSTILNVGFSTVGWFKENKFFMPLQANLVYSRPFAGRNITQNSVVTAEMVFFF